MDENSLLKRESGYYISSSAAATQKLGLLIAPLLSAEDVIVLSGDLGAGKTQLTKGIAQGLGIQDDITSPTFTIEMVYEGSKMPLYHFDLYRLNDAAELDDIGLFDTLSSDGPCVIEWGEQFIDELGDEHLDITIERMAESTPAGQEPKRALSCKPYGERAKQLIRELDALFV